MDAPERAAPAVLCALRFPAFDQAELVISDELNHSCKVYRLTFSQLRNLNASAADAIAKWPVTEKDAD